MTMDPNAAYTPIIDISYAQGRFDFARAMSRGVHGFIIRACNGNVTDVDLAVNIAAARSAGVADHQLGFYPFCNPKRCRTGVDQALYLIDAVHSALGHIDTLFMADIEDYARQGGSYPLLQGPGFAHWLNEYFDTIAADADHDRSIGYSNAAYYNTWVGDIDLARRLEWLVARYPVDSPAGYAAHPVPADPALWPGWAFARASGPWSPMGVPAAGWQFSAEFNGMGATYGAQSHDLDLNIVTADAWARWTKRYQPPVVAASESPPVTIIPPTTEDDMQIVIIENPAEYQASFIAEATNAGAVLKVTWVDGRLPESVAALAAHRANGAVAKNYPLAYFHNFWTNTVPVLDGVHPWTIHDFAGLS